MATFVPPPGEKPAVKVRKDGVWHPGELLMWTQREDGSWWANVQWRPRPGETYLDTVPATDVRLDKTEPKPG